MLFPPFATELQCMYNNSSKYNCVLLRSRKVHETMVVKQSIYFLLADFDHHDKYWLLTPALFLPLPRHNPAIIFLSATRLRSQPNGMCSTFQQTCIWKKVVKLWVQVHCLCPNSTMGSTALVIFSGKKREIAWTEILITLK